ncbi:MAG: UDP-N-acetylmuramoyl-L-alanyl-D-glutamate--2,6-diaminopimelate ligase, partial [Ignavibacteriaceae bacterium]|nr:UDP-N-acetylmuramoyl-L-alanyl-D-glutamate--2,6-diaminopimelate ligase [Ignavibacteriaceae bacterium]
MKLSYLLNSVNFIKVIGNIEKTVAGITSDSRKVGENFVFVAIKGFNVDGHKFIGDVVNNGAAAVIIDARENVDDSVFANSNVVKIEVDDSRKALAEISHCFYNEPSKKLKLIGVTGTNGKTTTTYFIKSILEAAGYKTGLVGTIVNMIGEKELPSLLTTPESNDLNELLNKMSLAGCEYAIMEVSSHSLVLNRVHALEFAAGVFTNITSDHLDFHKTFNNYLETKKILFNKLPDTSFGIYNLDDKSSSNFVDGCKAKLLSYGQHTASDYCISNISYNIEGTKFNLKTKGVEYPLFTKLIGEFNAYNAAAAFTVTTALGISYETAMRGIKNTNQVPGRFEVIGSGDKKAIIDYSHTADSLEKTLQALNELVKTERPIYTVFGCGGNRDKTKRPIMGKIASELSTKVIVTSDNPRFE